MALTVVDASVIIALLDPKDAHHDAATAAIRQARRQGGGVLLLPASAYSEILVHPMKSGPGSVAFIQEFCARRLQVEPLSPEIAVAAARLRASHDALRFPDALVIATAEETGADRLLTTDQRWTKYSSIAKVVGDSRPGSD